MGLKYEKHKRDEENNRNSGYFRPAGNGVLSDHGDRVSSGWLEE